MKRKWAFGVLFAAAVVALWSSVACAAEPTDDEKAALTELRTLVNIQPRPKTREEAVEKLKEILPKLEAFAEKHAKDSVGSQALILMVQVAIQVNDQKAMSAAAGKLVERNPDHAAVPNVKFLLATLKAQNRECAAAKEMLTEHLKAYPDFRAKAQVQKLLDKVSLIGTEAKDFESKDFADKAVKLSSFRGKVVLVDFFAGWCGPCRDEMPNLIKLYDKYHDRGFELVGVSLDKSLDEAKDYVTKQGLKWTVTFQEPGSFETPVAKLYGVEAIPAAYLLDKEGKILHVDLRGENLAQVLAELFPEKK